MNYTYLLIIVIFVLVTIYYIKNYTFIFTKIQTSFTNDPNQDCLFTSWSYCKDNIQRRDILVHNKGSGDTCSPLVRTCKEKATKYTWEPCTNSEQCIGEDKYCHVGDMRCMTETDCDWANDQDGTKRNCTNI
jgi:hypothetical protein